MIVTANKEAASFVLTSTVEKREESTGSKIARCLFLYCIGMEGIQTATVQLINMQSQEIVWSYSVHKASAKAYQSTAEAIAKHLKEFLENHPIQDAPDVTPIKSVADVRPVIVSQAQDAEQSPNGLSGSYSGTVLNTTLGVSAPFAIDLREENGGIYGCTTVQRPLVGSGGFHGSVNGSRVVFETAGKNLRIRFIGELQGNEMKGTYTVLSTQEHGDFTLKRISSDAPSIGFDTERCPRN